MSNGKWIGLAVILSAAGLLVYLMTPPHSPCPMPSREAIAKHLGLGGRIDYQLRDVRNVEVYVDNSAPMKNFAKYPNHPPGTIYSQVLAQIGSNPWDDDRVEWFWFGESIRPIAGVAQPWNKLAHDKSEYRDSWTRIGELIDHFTSRLTDTLNPGDSTVFIVVSDFVQAEPLEGSLSPVDWPYLANSLRQFMHVGYFEVFGLKSSYSGIHFSEITQSSFNVGSTVRRPFYLLVFGVDKQHVTLATRRLFAGQGAQGFVANAVSFSPQSQIPKARFIKAEVPGHVDSANRIRNPLILRNSDISRNVLQLMWTGDIRREAIVRVLIECLNERPDETSTYVGRGAVYSTAAVFSPRCTIDSLGPLKDSLGFETFKDRVLPADTLRAPDTVIYSVEHSFPPPAVVSGDVAPRVVRFSLWVEPDSIKVPTWIHEWSADDDSDPSQLDRTLNLKKIADRLVRSVGKDHPLMSACYVIE